MWFKLKSQLYFNKKFKNHRKSNLIYPNLNPVIKNSIGNQLPPLGFSSLRAFFFYLHHLKRNISRLIFPHTSFKCCTNLPAQSSHSNRANPNFIYAVPLNYLKAHVHRAIAGDLDERGLKALKRAGPLWPPSGGGLKGDGSR